MPPPGAAAACRRPPPRPLAHVTPSRSWNFTPAPGWTKEEAHTLKLCLMRHGVGRWVQILETGLLPGKLIQQLNGQTQRLLGQQSLAAYTGLQVGGEQEGMVAGWWLVAAATRGVQRGCMRAHPQHAFGWAAVGRPAARPPSCSRLFQCANLLN